MKSNDQRMIDLISFDLDGTLVDKSFAVEVWLEEIPRIYAEKWKIPFEEARNVIKREYDSVGDGKLEWYDLGYWLRRFDLRVKFRELFERCKPAIRTYPEVPETLKDLKGEGFRLVVLTNAPREFALFQLEATGIKKYFDRIFSSFSDFGKVKRSKETYSRVLEICGVSIPQAVHVGDHFEHDYLVPRELGMLAFYLDRSGKTHGRFILRDLSELKGRILEEVGNNSC